MSQHGTHTTRTKGLRVEILDSKYSNTVPFDQLTLVGEDIPEIFPITDEAPGVEILPHHAGPQYGEVAVLVDGIDSPAAFVAPAGQHHGGRNWSMASGSYIDTSDSRFPNARGLIVSRPIPLHNRYEVPGGVK